MQLQTSSVRAGAQHDVASRWVFGLHPGFAAPAGNPGALALATSAGAGNGI
jgi:hypothetical protein